MSHKERVEKGSNESGHDHLAQVCDERARKPTNNKEHIYVLYIPIGA